MSSAMLTPVAPPPKKKKFPLPLEKTCFGTFRADASEEKREECYSCSKYVDCIQISYKKQRTFKQEILRLVAGLNKRIEALQEASSEAAA